MSHAASHRQCELKPRVLTTDVSELLKALSARLKVTGTGVTALRVTGTGGHGAARHGAEDMALRGTALWQSSRTTLP